MVAKKWDGRAHFHLIGTMCYPPFFQMHHNVLKMVCFNLDFEGLV
jgi:hypothetical protein